MRVVEMFKSIDGEGIRTGKPVTFIRLFGCNLRCSYCDTKYGWDESCKGRTILMSFKEVVDEVERLDCKRITITGGEPMIHPGIEYLIDELLEKGYEVNVETNGTVPLPRKYRKCNKFIYTMDWKSISSGMNSKMSIDNVKTLRPNDVLKFVVGTCEDLEQVIEVCEQLESKPHVYLSPVFGKIQPSKIVEFILDHKLEYCTVQVQLHKIIWDPEERGV